MEMKSSGKTLSLARQRSLSLRRVVPYVMMRAFKSTLPNTHSRKNSMVSSHHPVSTITWSWRWQKPWSPFTGMKRKKLRHSPHPWVQFLVWPTVCPHPSPLLHGEGTWGEEKKAKTRVLHLLPGDVLTPLATSALSARGVCAGTLITGTALPCVPKARWL